MRTLIVYGTKSGVTEDCANEIAKRLKGETILVNLNKEKIKSINDYNTIIIGTPIYSGSINKKIKTFVIKFKNDLINKTIGLYTCGLSKEEEALLVLSKNIPGDLRNKAKVIRHFGGELRPEKLGLFLRFIVNKTLKGKKVDFKIDRNKIKDFCARISTKEK